MKPWRRRRPAILGAAVAGILVLSSCDSGSGAAGPTTPGDGRTDSAPARVFALGEFPEHPDGALPGSIAESLQAALDAAVEEGTFTGVTAAVIVADEGSWSGAAGAAGGVPLTPDSLRPTHSSGKTVVAAEVLRLAEDGTLDLDDLASEHLPPELEFFDANGATIRQVMGMRSNIPDLNEEDGYYPAEQASSAVEVFRMLPEPHAPPGNRVVYASTNYVLLGTIVEHVTGRPLADTLRSDVLDEPGLEGLVYTVEDALAADGWGGGVDGGCAGPVGV